jgi:hypothetical protein
MLPKLSNYLGLNNRYIHNGEGFQIRKVYGYRDMYKLQKRQIVVFNLGIFPVMSLFLVKQVKLVKSFLGFSPCESDTYKKPVFLLH